MGDKLDPEQDLMDDSGRSPRFKQGQLRLNADLETMGLDRSKLSIDEEKWKDLSDELRSAIGYYIFKCHERDRSPGRGQVAAKLRTLEKANAKIKEISIQFDPATRSILRRISYNKLRQIEDAFKVLEEELPIVAEEAQKCLSQMGQSGNFPNVPQLQLIRDLAAIYEKATGNTATVSHSSNKMYYSPFFDVVSKVFGLMGIRAGRKGDQEALANMAKRALQSRLDRVK